MVPNNHLEALSQVPSAATHGEHRYQPSHLPNSFEYTVSIFPIVMGDAESSLQQQWHRPHTGIEISHSARDSLMNLPRSADTAPSEASMAPSLTPGDGMGIVESSYAEGSSSVASFMSQVKDAVASRLSLSTQLDAAPDCWTMERSRQSTAEVFVLPSRTAADAMMDIYWNEVHVLYPFLHRPRFMQEYSALWSGKRNSDDLIYCILNTIFAITCQLYKRLSPAERSVDCRIYFGRATKLLRFDVIATGSLELIQALLLIGQYLQSTELPHSCWMVTGLAIRSAQGLGLHIPKASETQQDQETARRIWHGCVFMVSNIFR